MALVRSLAFVVAGAFATGAVARSNLDPCQAIARNPGWAGALIATQERWDVSPGTVLAILDQESSLKPNARGRGANGENPTGNFGYAQASLQTWNWFRRSSGREDAARSNFNDSAWFIGWYFAETSKRTRLGPSDTRGQYLAYKMGHGGYQQSGGRASSSVANVASAVAARAAAWDRKLENCLFSASNDPSPDGSTTSPE